MTGSASSTLLCAHQANRCAAWACASGCESREDGEAARRAPISASNRDGCWGDSPGGLSAPPLLTQPGSMPPQVSHLDPHQALLTPAEVAAVLRVTPRTVRRYGRTGPLVAVCLSKRAIRYTAASVTALIATNNDQRPAGGPGTGA